ncbi:MAG: tetratricopeptide repeat protein, partial [Xanthobacteraceae bacterium]
LARRLRAAAACLAIFSGVILSTLPAHADPVRGEATLATENGYARLVVKLDEDVDSEVSVAGSILIIRFKRAVEVPVDQLSDAVPDYVGSARRDPDGSAIRLALSRKVKINSMVAGERLFVDLLPDTWKGMPPGLPQEVVRELSERARAAERALRQQQAANAPKPLPPVRVRASVQPTFIRYVFELPENAGVSSSLAPHKFSVLFDKPLKFDLADATLVAPTNIGAITQRVDGGNSIIDFTLIGDVDVKAFREEKNYVVDVGVQPAALPVIPPKASKAVPDAPKNAAAEPAKASEASPQVAVATKPVAESVKAAEPKVAEPKSNPPLASVAAAASSATVESPAALPAASPATTAENVPVQVQRNSDGVRLNFAFDAATPAALFRRADAVWLVFDSAQALDLDAIRRDAKSVVGDVSRIALPNAQAIRMRLLRPQLVGLTGADDDAKPAANGQHWTLTFADTLKTSSEPLEARRNVADPRRATITIPLEGASKLHRLTDPDAGDVLLVVTARPPARGFIKRQDMVELSMLESVQGVVVRPKADDVAVTITADSVTLTRPGGLTLSSA